MFLSGGVFLKKLWGVILLCMLLSGCGAEETFETVSDPAVVPVAAVPAQVVLQLPRDAAAPVLETGGRKIYECEDFEILLENRPSGDLRETVRCLTGFDAETLTVMKTRQGSWDRYEFVWTCLGEQGQRLGKAAVLDDGSCHYCLSVLWDASAGEENREERQQVLSSFALAEN